MALHLYAPVIVLPFDVAILFAAEQNFMSDKRRGMLTEFEDWAAMQSSYIEEAKELLADDGQNYIPEFEDMPLIRLSDAGEHCEETTRSQTLNTLFDMYHTYCDQIKLPRPDPFKARINFEVDNQLQVMTGIIRKKQAH